MISQGLHTGFILFSIILGYQDIQSRTVNAWIYGLTILLGISYSYVAQIPLIIDHFISMISFICVIFYFWWFKKEPVIAVADIIYMIVILYALQTLWTIFFIILGITALCWHQLNKKKSHQPFIALMLIAYIITIRGQFFLK